MSFPNYVDFDYWAYQYAEGDIRSIQDGLGLILGNGIVTAIPTFITPFQAQGIFLASSSVVASLGVQRESAGDISAAGNVSVIVSNFRPGSATIDATGAVSADGIRLRTVSGTSTGESSVSATGQADYSGGGSISGVAFVIGQANYTAISKGIVNAQGLVNANLYKYGEEWSNIPDESNAWVEMPSQSNIWTTQPSGNNTWLRKG